MKTNELSVRRLWNIGHAQWTRCRRGASKLFNSHAAGWELSATKRGHEGGTRP